jgi:hypothetical protein
VSLDPLYPNIRLLADALESLSSTDERGPVVADMNDLLEISRWLIAQMSDVESKLASPDSLETFLIDLDLQLDHIRFHTDSMKASVAVALSAFPPDA